MVQYNDLVRVHDGADPLGHQELGRAAGFFLQGLPQLCIRLKIQGGKTVVKYIDGRIFYQSPGNGEPLLLAAGHIAPALGNQCVKQVWFRLDEFHGLGGTGRTFNLFLPGCPVTVSQVGADGA